MALRVYLFGLFATIIVSGGLLVLLFLGVNPYQSPSWIIALFYSTLILFATTLFAIIGFYLKIWVSNREVIFSHILPTLRQSFFIGLILVGILFLRQIKALNWWIAAMLIIAIFLVELFYRTKK